jgi:hypothetical protein
MFNKNIELKWLQVLLQIVTGFLGILMCLPVGLEEIRGSYGFREFIIDFLEWPFVIPLAFFIIGKCVKDKHSREPRRLRIATLLFIIGSLRYMLLFLVPHFWPKTVG